MWLFWLGVIAKNGYNLWFHGKDKAFIAQHKQNIVVLKQAADDREKAILTEYEEQRQALENKSGWQAHCGDFLPEYYRNPTDTQALYEILSNGRADTFKEAYEVLANQKQRELMARHERMQTEAAQRAAQAQQQAANETAALAQRQAQAAEDQAREVERHNREVEARWR